MPSYEERRKQMEQVLKTSINVSFYGEFNPSHRYLATINRCSGANNDFTGTPLGRF
jgi:hypothetical protein